MKKIMFNDRYGLTEAVIVELKKQTRRLMENQSGNLAGQIVFTKKGSSLLYVRADFDNGISEDCPYAIGEIVAVAQNYLTVYGFDWMSTARPSCFAEREFAEMIIGWNNKMFVKANLMPHQLRILDVRAERLQDIADEDCLKEGVSAVAEMDGYNDYYLDYPQGQSKKLGYYSSAHEAFASLIDKISGKGTWNANPFVWRIEFELIK